MRGTRLAALGLLLAACQAEPSLATPKPEPAEKPTPAAQTPSPSPAPAAPAAANTAASNTAAPSTSAEASPAATGPVRPASASTAADKGALAKPGAAEAKPGAAELADTKPGAAPQREARKGAVVSEEPFSAWLEGDAPLSANEPSTLRVVLQAKPPYHCNAEYPHKFTLAAPAGINYPSPIVKGMKVTEAEGVLPVPVVAGAAGKATVKGNLAFSVCTAERCLVEKRELALDLDIR